MSSSGDWKLEYLALSTATLEGQVIGTAAGSGERLSMKSKVGLRGWNSFQVVSRTHAQTRLQSTTALLGIFKQTRSAGFLYFEATGTCHLSSSFMTIKVP